MSRDIPEINKLVDIKHRMIKNKINSFQMSLEQLTKLLDEIDTIINSNETTTKDSVKSQNQLQKHHMVVNFSYKTKIYHHV